MPYTKLDHNILYSSIWAEDMETKLVWITILLLTDQNGFVSATTPGIAMASGVPLAATRKAIQILESPDPESKNPKNNGRRIKRIEGGYTVLNFDDYRDHDYSNSKMATYMREYRKKKELTECKDNLQKTNNVITNALHAVSVSESISDINPSKIKNKIKKEIYGFNAFWVAYPKKVGRGAAEKAFERIAPDCNLLIKMVEALEWQRTTKDWMKDKGQFIPHPSTWLNQRRWEDEPYEKSIKNNEAEEKELKKLKFHLETDIENKATLDMDYYKKVLHLIPPGYKAEFDIKGDPIK